MVEGKSVSDVAVIITGTYVVTGSICPGVSGPTATHTKLGWVLSGPVPPSESVLHSSACVVTTHLLRVDGTSGRQLSHQSQGMTHLSLNQGVSRTVTLKSGVLHNTTKLDTTTAAR